MSRVSFRELSGLVAVLASWLVMAFLAVPLSSSFLQLVPFPGIGPALKKMAPLHRNHQFTKNKHKSDPPFWMALWHPDDHQCDTP